MFWYNMLWLLPSSADITAEKEKKKERKKKKKKKEKKRKQTNKQRLAVRRANLALFRF